MEKEPKEKNSLNWVCKTGSVLKEAIFFDFIISHYTTAICVIDKCVFEAFGVNWLQPLDEKNILKKVFVVDVKEDIKSLQSFQALQDRILPDVNSKSCILVVGGGVLSDLVGFTAATLHRGIDWVFFPTTLLSMADSCLGGKTGINHPHGKNLIGAFHPPKAIFIDPLFLKTLPKERWIDGWMEIFKHKILSDPKKALEVGFFGKEVFEESYVEGCINASLLIKKEIVQKDYLDRDTRRLLNLGHTVGHALEQASCYRLSHGHAVGWGILCEAQIAQRRGFLSSSYLSSLEKILRPHLSFCHLPFDSIEKYLYADKKREGDNLHIPLISEEMVKMFTIPFEDVFCSVKEGYVGKF